MPQLNANKAIAVSALILKNCIFMLSIISGVLSIKVAQSKISGNNDIISANSDNSKR